MTITNDTITFESTDIEQFSGPVHKALIIYFGERLAPEIALSDIVNAVIKSATESLKKQSVIDLTPLAEALATADKGKQDQVKILIDQAKAVVGVTDEVVVDGGVIKGAVEPK